MERDAYKRPLPASCRWCGFPGYLYSIDAAAFFKTGCDKCGGFQWRPR